MNEEKIKKYHKLASIISYAVMAIIIIYALTIEIFKNAASGFKPLLEPQTAMTVKYASFLIVALVFIAIKQVSKAKLKSEKNKTAEEFLKNIFAVSVLRAAIFEVPSFIGFILFFLAGAYVEFYILSFFSFIMVILYFPNRDEWDKELKNKFVNSINSQAAEIQCGRKTILR
ncbi:MAG: hypothetical protein L6420_02980 [Elusimicrobia bacterium]|nr:hypothetical protein [Elusimicrobiota bacterium]